jgi:lambda repressor-like predicted transcriptional regulator
MPPFEKRSPRSSTSSTPSMPVVTAAALRAAIGRDGRHIYQIAADAGVHPSSLGRMLVGSLPLRQDVAARVLEVVRDPDAV